MSWQDIPGWFGFRETYDEAVAKAPWEGATFVEIGVGFGRSIAYLARKVLDSGKRVRIYAVDPWDASREWGVPAGYEGPDPGWGGEYNATMRAFGDPFRAFVHYVQAYEPRALEFIRVLRCTSAEASRLIDPRSCDMVMIDGDHSYEAVVQDIALWKMKVKTRGLLCGDDYSADFPGVVRAVGEAFGEGGFTVQGTTWGRVMR